MKLETFLNNLLKDIRVELLEEFDKNFERKAFFDQPWPQRKYKAGDNLLNIHGNAGLRGSIGASIGNGAIYFTSSLPYAKIHNEGGQIVVTAKMKKYFWAMHLLAKGGAQIFNIKSKKQVNNKRTQALSTEAEMWKAMALKKIGSTIKMPKRQFIGQHPQMDVHIKRVIDSNIKELTNELSKQFKTPLNLK